MKGAGRSGRAGGNFELEVESNFELRTGPGKRTGWPRNKRRRWPVEHEDDADLNYENIFNATYIYTIRWHFFLEFKALVQF